MPGVLNSNSKSGFSREVGKMANFIDPGLLNMDTDGLEDIANRVLFGSSTSPFADFMDSDNELPDNETPMDLLKYLETDNSFLELDCGLACDNDCNDHGHGAEAPNKYIKVRSSRQDPFMGMSNQESSSPTAKNSLLSQMMSPLDYDFEQQMQQQKAAAQSFVAWGHRSFPIKEEPDSDDYGDEDEELTKSSISHLNNLTYQDDDEGIDTALPVTFIDTPSPSSQSGTATGDDSDVDIETVTETPYGTDSCGYFTQDSAPPSRAGSPSGLMSSSLHSMLTKSSGLISPPSSTCSSASSSPRPSPTVHFNTYGVSSSASLAENLMKGRTSLLGQKRKHSKEKRVSHHHHHHHHHTLEHRISSSHPQPYTHVLCTSNSINFHDYAMSPLSPECSSPPMFNSTLSSTDTGLPTISAGKRVYKRKQLPLDASDKEKQHHHNQLERNRRQKLADLFIDLRDEVPKISCQSKASKVMILNEATSYVYELRQLDANQAVDIATELRRKEELTRQLRSLKAQLGSSRIG